MDIDFSPLLLARIHIDKFEEYECVISNQQETTVLP